MAIMLFILFLLAGFHFILEGIILPARRTALRFRLFEMRDELRRLKEEEIDSISDDVYHHVQECINNAIFAVPYMDYSVLYKFRKDLKNNKELKEIIIEKKNLMESCKNEQVKELYVNVVKVNQEAVVCNTLALNFKLAIVIIPILLVFFFWYTRFKKLNAYFSNSSQSDMERYVGLEYGSTRVAC